MKQWRSRRFDGAVIYIRVSTKEQTENLSLLLRSSQVALRECATGTRFQILFERNRAALVGELDRDVDDPRPALRCMRDSTGVVRGDAASKVGGQSSVISRGLGAVLQNIDSRRWHARMQSKRMAAAERTNFG